MEKSKLLLNTLVKFFAGILLVDVLLFSVTIWLFLSIPLILGSWWALLCFIPYPILIAVRIKNEEKILEAGLSGYTEYKQKVLWKILPFVW